MSTWTRRTGTARPVFYTRGDWKITEEPDSSSWLNRWEISHKGEHVITLESLEAAKEYADGLMKRISEPHTSETHTGKGQDSQGPQDRELALEGLSDAVISAIHGLQKMQESLTRVSEELQRRREEVSKDSGQVHRCSAHHKIYIRCTKALGHRGNHRDIEGNEWTNERCTSVSPNLRRCQRIPGHAGQHDQWIDFEGNEMEFWT